MATNTRQPDELLQLYRDADRQSAPPVISETESSLLREHLDSLGYSMLAGFWGRPGDHIDFLSSGERAQGLSNLLIGPYILSSKYIPEAIGFWGVKPKPTSEQILYEAGVDPDLLAAAQTRHRRQEATTRDIQSDAYITESSDLPAGLRVFFEENQSVLISGKPTHHFPVEGDVKYYTDCDRVEDMPLRVSSVIMKSVPQLGNRHLPACVIGDYAVVTGQAETTGDSFTFALIEDFGVSISPAT